MAIHSATMIGRVVALLVKGVGIAPTDAELIRGLKTANYITADRASCYFAIHNYSLCLASICTTKN